MGQMWNMKERVKSGRTPRFLISEIDSWELSFSEKRKNQAELFEGGEKEFTDGDVIYTVVCISVTH